MYAQLRNDLNIHIYLFVYNYVMNVMIELRSSDDDHFVIV